MFKKLLQITLLIILLLPIYISAEYVENPNFKQFYVDWDGDYTIKDPWKKEQFVWDKYYTKAEYDSSTKVLRVSYGVFFNREPHEEYLINMVVGNNLGICNQKLRYESFYMIGECTVNIEDIEMAGAYKLKNIITDAEGSVLDKSLLEVTVTGYESNFSWKDITINEFMIDEGNTMKILGGFYHDITELYDDYRIRFYKIDPIYGNKKLKGENLNLHYSTGSSALEFDAILKNVNVDGEEKFYYEILDHSSRVIGNGEFKYNFTQQEDDINWKKIEGDAYYNTDKNRLFIKAYLAGVTLKPHEQYTISIAIKGGGIRYSGELLYDDKKDQLYSIIEFRGKDKKYSFEYQIQNESYRVIEEGVFKIQVDYKKKGFSDVEEESGSEIAPEAEKKELTKTPSKLEIAINSFVEKQRKKYPNDNDLIDRLEKTKLVLNLYAEKKKKYKSLIEEINSILQQKIDELR